MSASRRVRSLLPAFVMSPRQHPTPTAGGRSSPGGAAALPFLKQLADNGPLVAKVTKEQAAAAHEFEVNLVKLKEGSSDLARSLANELLPSMNNWTEQLLRAKELTGGLATGLMLLSTMNPFRSQSANMAAYRKDLDELAAARVKYADDPKQVANIDRQTEAIKQRLEVLKLVQRQEILDAQRGKDLADQNDRMAARAKANKPLADLPGKGGSTGFSAYDQEWNHLIGMMREADKAAAGVAASVLHALDAGDFGKVTTEQRKQLLNLAAEVEYDQERNKSQKEMAEGIRKNIEDEARQAEQRNRQLDQEAQHWKDIIDQLEPYRRQRQQINELYENAKLNSEEWAKASDEVDKRMKALGEETKKAEDHSHQFGLTMSSALGRMITDGMKAGDVMKSLGRDIAQMITKITILQPLENSLASLYKDSGESIGGFFKSIFGGGSTGDFGAAVVGGPAYASGTDYVPQTGWAFLHQGEAVVPAAQNAAGDVGNRQPVVVHFHINAVDARSVNQLLARPETQRMIRGVIEHGYANNGTTSGMAYN